MDETQRVRIEEQLNQIWSAVTSRGLPDWWERTQEHEQLLEAFARDGGPCLTAAVVELRAIPRSAFHPTGKMGDGESKLGRAVAMVRECLEREVHAD